MKNVIIYESHFELIKSLTNEQAGVLIKSIGDFSKAIEPTITDPLVMGIFMVIRRDFELQSINYKKKVEVNRQNGKFGGRPKTHNNPIGFPETQHNPQNLKDKDKDKDKEKEKDIDREIDIVLNKLNIV
jgi:hypothetical protein